MLLDDLRREFDAVFLGLGGINLLGLVDEDIAGLGNAVEFIAGLRQATDYAALLVGRRVVVLGGGMTVVDAAVQSKKLGASEVTIVYRRDQQRMPASTYEQQWAQRHGVTIRAWSVLDAIGSSSGHVEHVTFVDVVDRDGSLELTGTRWTLEADTVLKAIGQTLVFADPTVATLALRGGRIAVDHEGRTSLPDVWAGGDCTFGGRDLTVEAVEHGKVAAMSINRSL